jgi:uncharacterized protein (DUF1501 family)
MAHKPPANRRDFLRRSLLGLAPALPGAGAWLWSQDASAANQDYKALVCISLTGANDGYNMVLASDDASWSVYSQLRGQGQGIGLNPPGSPPVPSSDHLPARWGGALALPGVLGGANTQRAVALHPCMPASRDLYAAGRLAILANVGPLIAPMTQGAWLDARVRRPDKLFAHADQLATWHTFAAESQAEGWGGRFMDLLNGSEWQARQSDPVRAQMVQSFSCMSPGAHTAWLQAQTMRPFYCTREEAIQTWWMWEDNRDYRTALQRIMVTPEDDHLLAQAYQDVTRRGQDAAGLLSSRLPALGQAPWSTPGHMAPARDPALQYVSPVNGQTWPNMLAQQLQMVARLIDANLRGDMGLRRQCFHVVLDGFDHHDRQNAGQAELLAQLDQALGYFDQALSGMPSGDLRAKVTTFTASEFGRTFSQNGDGTDHGWGNHQLIMGGAVRGGQLYGRLPVYGRPVTGQPLFDSPDQLHAGVMLPSTSVSQMAATLGRWMGLDDPTLNSLIPSLQAFPAELQDLGFMG